MSLKPITQIVRAIPNWAGAPEQFFEVTNIPREQKNTLRKELEDQGFFLQEIFPSDTMNVLVAAEIRKRIAAEQETKK